MTIEAVTRHEANFDILSHPIDPAESPYADGEPGYVDKIKGFYQELAIDSAIWAWPKEQTPKFVECGKEYEYLLYLDPSRIVAYVNEKTWSPYLYGERDDFEYSHTHTSYEHTSLIICTPLDTSEVATLRKYHRESPNKFSIVEERPWP